MTDQNTKLPENANIPWPDPPWSIPPYVVYTPSAPNILLPNTGDNPWILTAGGILPAVDIDLVNYRAWVKGSGFVDPASLLSITRASQEYYTDVQGNIYPITSNTLAVGNAGLQIWEGRTNLCLASQAVGTSPWLLIQSSSSNPVVTNNATTAPDGTTTGSQLVFPTVATGAGNRSLTYQPFTGATIGTTYTFSIYLKGNVGGEVNHIGFNNGTAQFVSIPVTLTTSWQRFSFSWTQAATSNMNVDVGSDQADVSQIAGISAQTIFAWGAQVEAGTFATPYIPTSVTSVTRAADIITAAGRLLTALTNTAGGIYLQTNGVNGSGNSSQTRLISWDADVIAWIENSATTVIASSASAIFGSGTRATRSKLAMSWNTSNLASLVANAGSTGTGAFTLGSRSAAAIGNNPTGNRGLNGNIERLVVWGTPLLASTA